MEAGVSILNVGEGDTKLSFDPEKPDECYRAGLIVTDMLKRGYAILIRIGDKDGEPIYTRVKAFDRNTYEYIIDNLSPEEERNIADLMASDLGKDLLGKKKRGRKRRIAAATVPAVAVARTARGCSPGSWE